MLRISGATVMQRSSRYSASGTLLGRGAVLDASIAHEFTAWHVRTSNAPNKGTFHFSENVERPFASRRDRVEHRRVPLPRRPTPRTRAARSSVVCGDPAIKPYSTPRSWAVRSGHATSPPRKCTIGVLSLQAICILPSSDEFAHNIEQSDLTNGRVACASVPYVSWQSCS